MLNGHVESHAFGITLVCLSLGNLFKLSEAQFLYLYNGQSNAFLLGYGEGSLKVSAMPGREESVPQM